MRFSPTSLALGKPINFRAADDVQKFALGTRITAVDQDYSSVANVPNGGGGEFVYVKGASTFIPGRLVHVDKDWNLLDVPNTASTCRPCFVAVSGFTSTQLYGWVQRSGMVPIATSTAGSTGALYIGAAGQVTTTQANGKQVLNATSLIAGSGSFTRSIKTVNGSKFVQVNDVTGMFVGQAVSGTGVAASSTIADIDPSGQAITLNNACTASDSVTGTFTHTGYVIAHIENPFVQGQVV